MPSQTQASDLTWQAGVASGREKRNYDYNNQQSARIMQALEKLTSGHPFLAGLDPHLCALFNDCASLRRFGSQQCVFHEGGEADHFYLILTGKLSLESHVDRLGTVVIQTLAAGDALGWSWLLPPYRWEFTASTLAPTDVISFDAAALRNKAAQNLEFRGELLARINKTLVRRLHGARTQLIDLYRSLAPSSQRTDDAVH
jgi:CRP-like cAMP-binding protein